MIPKAFKKSSCSNGKINDGSDSAKPSETLVHRRRIELALDALEMIEPLDRAVELRAVFLGELGLHFGNRVGELGPIQILHRGGDIRQHGEALVGHFGKTAEHDDLLMCAARRQ